MRKVVQPKFEDDLDVPFAKREITNGNTFAQICDFLLPGTAAPSECRTAPTEAPVPHCTSTRSALPPDVPVPTCCNNLLDRHRIGCAGARWQDRQGAAAGTALPRLPLRCVRAAMRLAG
jgi:hypothetical protein